MASRLSVKARKAVLTALENADSNYYNKSGHIVNGKRQFAGFCIAANPNNPAAATGTAKTKQARVRAIGKEKYIARLQAELAADDSGKVKGTLFGKANPRPRGSGGSNPQPPRTDGKDPGSKLPRVWFKKDGSGGFTAVDSKGKRVGSIKSNGKGRWTPTPQSGTTGTVGKLRVAKQRIAFALHMSYR